MSLIRFDAMMMFGGRDFVGLHLVVCSDALRWESDDFRFELPAGFVLSHEFQDTLMNEVFNGPAGSIRQFSEFSHHTLIEFV